MALTRKSLKAMGLTDEQVDSIAEEHGETVKALKQEIDDLKNQVAEGENAKTELEALKKGDYKKKFDDLTKEYSDYKAKVEGEAEKTAKEAAVRAYFESKSITGKNLEIAVRGATSEIAAVKLKDGKIEDASALDELVNGTFASLVVKTETKGANTATPPVNGGTKKLTKEEIAAIKDTAERQKAIAENLELYT